MSPRHAFLLLFLVIPSHRLDAAVRCDLASSTGTAGSCIDPKLLAGQTLQVPANVTRIGEGGLKLCTPTNVSKLSSDIAYVIDNSRSMDAWGFYANPATADTTWYIPDCGANNSGTPVTTRLRHFGGTSGVDSLQWDTLIELSSKLTPGQMTGGCMEANDPYSVRAQVVRAALNYQASFDPSAMAGVIYFNKAVTEKFGMRALSSAGLADLLRNTGLYNSASGTLWAPPLDTAMRWLSAVPQSGRQKAIILVSDGEPTDAAKYISLLGQDGQPPIYAIYLGEATDPTPQIDNVTSLTLGQKFVVPPNRPDSLEGVIKSIVASVSTKETPASSVLQNITNGQSSRSLALGADTLETWKLQLDSAVALSVGPNLLRWITTWRGSNGLVVDTSSFVLDVSGPNAMLGELPIPSTSLSAKCYEGSTLSFFDSAWSPVGYLTEGAGRFGLALAPSGAAQLPLNLSITSGASDLERLSLSSLDSIMSGVWGRKMGVSVARLAPAIPGNQNMEVRAGLDTLRSSWCHPRDARDCAEASIEVRAFREAQIRWIPHSLPGSSGSFILEAVLPGQVANAVAASVLRHGVAIGTRTLNRVRDSLFRDTVPFVQGPRRPGADTLWLPAPSASVPDSLVASMVWGLDLTVLQDTALIYRPQLKLQLDWTGVDDDVMITLDGGQPDSRGLRTVRLSASTRTQSVVLDSTARGLADVTSLASTGNGASTWIKGIFVDPVYGDTAVDSVIVPVPRVYLRFTAPSTPGPVGSVGLVADIPDAAGSSLLVEVWRRAVRIGVVTLLRQPDSTFAGVVNFRQGPSRPGTDSVWMNLPNAKLPDSLSVRYVRAATGDTMVDTTLVTRPALSMLLRSLGGTNLSIDVLGGFADSRGQRQSTVMVTTSQNAVLDSTGHGTADVLDQLTRTSSSQVMVRAFFVDPVYGDTARDSLQIAVPQRSIRFATASVSGPRGTVQLDVVDPWTSADTRTVVIAHGRDSTILRLTRTPSGSFSGTVTFAQVASAFGDTLALGRPLNGGNDSLYAILPRQDSLPVLVDRVMITRPSLSLVLIADPDRAQVVQIRVDGGMADSRGEARVSLSGPVAIPSTQLISTGNMAWGGERGLSQILPESPDPVIVKGLFVDPIYGDSVWASVSVKSPWFASRIEVYPQMADPRRGDTVEIRVYDKDVDSNEVGHVDVKVGSRSFSLTESGNRTGEYVLRIPAGELDPDWIRHDPRELWAIEIVYTDPDHPLDVSHIGLLLKFSVPPPTVEPLETLLPMEKSTTFGQPVLKIVKPDADHRYPKGTQGIELKIWEKTKVTAYLYDKLGVAMGSWEGTLEPTDASTASFQMVHWNGRDGNGNPAITGIYLIRVVLLSPDGFLLGNYVYRVGRR